MGEEGTSDPKESDIGVCQLMMPVLKTVWLVANWQPSCGTIFVPYRLRLQQKGIYLEVLLGDISKNGSINFTTKY